MANNNKANASIQQYEPLRVPSSWDAQGKGFAVRLQDILDDIYKRFGRLNAMDFTPEVRQEIVSIPIISGTVSDIVGTPEKPGLIDTKVETQVEAAEGRITLAVTETAASAASSAVNDAKPGIVTDVKSSVLSILPGEIKAEVSTQTEGIADAVESSVVNILPDKISATVNTYGIETTSVTLDSNGVAIESYGNFTVAAGGYVGVQAGDTNKSFINLGSVFTASSTYGVTADKAEFKTLTVNGQRISPDTLSQFPIYFSMTKPNHSNCVWLKPVASVSTSGLAAATYSAAVSGTGTANYLPDGANKTYALSSSNSMASGGTQYVYKLSFTVSNLSTSNRAYGTIVAYIGSTEIGRATVNLGVGQSDSFEMTKTTSTNLCPSTAVSLRLTSSCSGAVYLKNGSAIMLDVTSDASVSDDSYDTAPVCEVRFVF